MRMNSNGINISRTSITKWPHCLACSLLIVCFWANASHAENDDAVDSLLEEYAVISLSYRSDEDLEAPLLTLLKEAERSRDANVENAAFWVACARIRFAYANTQGAVSGMRLIARSRDDLEKAISLDPVVYEGYAKAYLGYLYSVMPSWPISFGDKEKGRKFVEEALLISEKNFRNNYYYAWYLTVVGDYDAARKRLDIAEAAIVPDPLLPRLQELSISGIKGLRNQIDELEDGKR
jgi:tetratricopeptide (TPR) repeat protein